MPVKITNGQLFSLLLMVRLFSECMNFPAVVATYGMQRFLVILLTKLCVLALYTPLMLLARKHPGESFFSIMAKKSRVLAWIVCILYTIYIVRLVLGNVVKLEFFTTSTIMTTADSWVIITLMFAVVAYGVVKGIQAVARFGPLILTFFLLAVFVASLSLAHRMNFTYLYPNLLDSPDTLLSDITTEIIKCSEIFIFSIICQFTNQKAHRAILIYIPVLFVTIEYMTLLCITVLGPYIELVSFPYYTLASLVDIIVFERIDGIDAAIWTISCIMKMILYFICIKTMFTILLKENVAKIITLSLCVVACGLGILLTNAGHTLLFYQSTALTFSMIVVFCVICPLIAMIMGRRKASGNDKKETPQNSGTDGAPASP